MIEPNQNADVPSDPLTHLGALKAPTPVTVYVHLDAPSGLLRHTLRPELVRLFTTALTALAAVRTATPPTQVYDDAIVGAERIEQLVHLDAAARATLGTDVRTAVAFVESAVAPADTLHQVLRAVNQLRTAILRIDDAQLSAAVAAICAVLMADLLEIAPFV